MIGLDELEDVNRVGRGFVVGAVFAVCTVVMLVVWVLLNRGADSPSPSIAQRVFLGLAAAIIVAGYLSGLASVVYRPARRLVSVVT